MLHGPLPSPSLPLPLADHAAVTGGRKSKHLPSLVLHGRRRCQIMSGRVGDSCRGAAVAKDLEVGAASEEEDVVLGWKEGCEDKVEYEYDWREEWYPLYLSKDVPDDAPLGLTVFDQQIVLCKDGDGVVRCYEDRCPHRLAKLSEGQLMDGKLECLYHGWQFQGDGKCVKIPQALHVSNLTRSETPKVWMSKKNAPDSAKLPFLEHCEGPGFQDLFTMYELPYDHSVLLENLVDPAHVPISHDRRDFTAKREDAQALFFKVLERTNRGFAGQWGKVKDPSLVNFLRFEAPCVLQNKLEFVDKKGEKQFYSALFLCRPAGQGKSMIILRFGIPQTFSPLANVLPKWYSHHTCGKVLEEDMGFLSSQNEVLLK